MIDVIIHWSAVVVYVIATIANSYGIIFKKQKAENMSYAIVLLGLLIHSTALVYRWHYSGHGPYMTRYEVLSSNAWVALVMFLIFTRIFQWIRQVSIIVFPSVFLLVALGLFTNPGIQKLPPTLRSIWLVLHVTFYKIALGTLLVALAFSVFIIFKKKMSGKWLQNLSNPDTLDLSAYRFAGFGFTFWAIGMLAGSIWAYQSWGRFWGWDPVETWSLITWIFFGIYLHLRRFFGWKGERAAYFFILCFLFSLATVFFTPLIESSIHSEYFR